MKVKLNQAAKVFFGTSSLEMVYIEAVANALDADATKIEIDIDVKANNQPQTLQVTIKDNGIGFTDERFEKFCNLFDVDEDSHKGLGRLVYLCYFENTDVSSNYGGVYHRDFRFSDAFDNKSKVTTVKPTESGTTLTMSGYQLSKFRDFNYLQPKYLKKRILEEFYPKLYQLKEQSKKIEINITADIGGSTHTESFSTDEIPALTQVELDGSVSLIDKMYIHYSIQECDNLDSSVVTAISVDNRTQKVEIISKENTPVGYEMVFLLNSDWFVGKIDLARQNLTVSGSDLRAIKSLFRKKVSAIIEQYVPKIAELNKQARISLLNSFPHLDGYFDDSEIGFSSRNDVLKNAQDKFFYAQKEILDAVSLTDEQYDKSLELSSRTLTEYIIFRQMIINKLKDTNQDNKEAYIHNLICKMRRRYDGNATSNDLFNNNAWIFDDKYMTYNVVLSEREMTEVVDVITEGEVVDDDDDRPDIALIFSNNPESSPKVDVVIVELKKKGLTLEENMKVVTQLEKRARKLMQHYGNKIQRIWYYGVVEFNEDLELHLSGEYQELYSTGKMYYRETKIAISKDPLIQLPIGVFVMDLDSVVSDASIRNSTFLNLIKSKFVRE
jgi:hypothetical protein